MNNIETLREHLFSTLAALNDKNQPMEIERAKAISEVAQTIINSAKVEVEYAKATGAVGSNFLEMAPIKTPPLGLPSGITGVTTHRIRG